MSVEALSFQFTSGVNRCNFGHFDFVARPQMPRTTPLGMNWESVSRFYWLMASGSFHVSRNFGKDNEGFFVAGWVPFFLGIQSRKILKGTDQITCEWGQSSHIATRINVETLRAPNLEAQAFNKSDRSHQNWIRFWDETLLKLDRLASNCQNLKEDNWRIISVSEWFITGFPKLWGSHQGTYWPGFSTMIRGITKRRAP